MLELRILTGLHRGATLPLDGDAIRIGSGPENDIVLIDPGMPPVAGALYRSAQSGWRYRSCAAMPSNSKAEASGDTPLIAGARWFAGPVLIGCDEEGSPWPTGQPQPGVPQWDASDARPIPSDASRSFNTRLRFALAAAIGLACIVAALVVLRSRPTVAPSAVSTSSTEPALDAASAPVRVVQSTVYPSQAVHRPPFEIRSASMGPYGFVVTRDDQVLIPGSRRGAFTLVRIEPGRAVFTGPHPAELTW